MVIHTIHVNLYGCVFLIVIDIFGTIEHIFYSNDLLQTNSITRVLLSQIYHAAISLVW